MAQIQCPKCAGTGVVSAFLDYKGGACFDCNGSGVLAVRSPRVGAVSSLRSARLIGDAAMADRSSVSDEEAAAAFAVFEATSRLQWNQRDYDRRNALIPNSN